MRVSSVSPKPGQNRASVASGRRREQIDPAATWLQRRYRVKPSMAGLIAQLAGLGVPSR